MNLLPPILLVDDDAGDRELVALVLTGAFGEVSLEVVADAATLTRALAARRFGLVITDFRLPWIDGAEVVRLAREVRPDCAVVLLAASVSDELVEEAVRIGVDAFVPKSSSGFVGLPPAVRGALYRARRRALASAKDAPYRRVFEGVPAGLFVAASSGEIMEANPGMARILGYGSAEEITRRSINQLLPDGEAAERWRVGLASRETLEDIQTTLRRADGSNATVRMSARWVEGEVPGTRQLLGMVHEVQATAVGGVAPPAEGGRFKEELEQMVYVVAHDLQQPLNVVGRFLDLIAERDGERLSEAGRDYLEHATSASSNLQRMVDAVLRYARVDTSDQQFEAVDLNRTFDKAVTLLEQEIEESGAQIDRDELPAVMADEAQMVQLFHNLLGNAVKFRGERTPVVHAAAEERPQEWVLSLQDNGIGIDSSASERIFQMFQRLHTDVEYPGTGIGLAVCKRIVSHHGGRIWVESTPGEGTTFFVALPKRNVPVMMEE